MSIDIIEPGPDLIGKYIIVKNKLIIPELQIGKIYKITDYSNSKGLEIAITDYNSKWWNCFDNVKRKFFGVISKKLRPVISPKSGSKIMQICLDGKILYGTVIYSYRGGSTGIKCHHELDDGSTFNEQIMIRTYQLQSSNYFYAQKL